MPVDMLDRIKGEGPGAIRDLLLNSLYIASFCRPKRPKNEFLAGITVKDSINFSLNKVPC